MKDILIFRHVTHEGPGYLADFLNRHSLSHRLIRIDQYDPIPDTAKVAAGLVFMGGPMSVNDNLPWIPKALSLIRDAVGRDVPVLGHCLGGQLMSKALGGRVTRHRVKEIGWGPVQALPSAETAKWLNGLPPRFEVFHWHGETFSLPSGATHLLRSRYCRNQAYVLGKHLALQCHVEMTRAMVRTWASEGEDEITAARASPAVQTRAQMLTSLPRRVENLQQVADTLYSRWIQGLRP
jgi:GMP synthase-like glutamine amidotransferase